MNFRLFPSAPMRIGAIAVACALATTACGSSEPLEAAAQLESSNASTTSTTAPSIAEDPAEPQATTSTPSTTLASEPLPALCSDGPELDGIVVPTSWEVGETRELVVEIAKEDSGSPTPSGASATPVTITALEVDESGVLLEWLAAETDLSAIGIDPRHAGDVATLLDDVPKERIVYRIDTAGNFVGAENVNEIRANAIAAIDVLSKAMQIDASSREGQSMTQTAQLFETMDADTLTNFFAQRTIVFHGFDGLTLSEGQRIESPDSMLNPLGGEPFPATTSIVHFPERDADGCEVVRIQTTPDVETLLPTLIATLGEAAGVDTDSDQAEIDALTEQFNFTTWTTMQLDPSTGAVRRMAAVKDISANGRQRVDTTTITVLDD